MALCVDCIGNYILGQHENNLNVPFESVHGVFDWSYKEYNYEEQSQAQPPFISEAMYGDIKNAIDMGKWTVGRTHKNVDNGIALPYFKLEIADTVIKYIHMVDKGYSKDSIENHIQKLNHTLENTRKHLKGGEWFLMCDRQMYGDNIDNDAIERAIDDFVEICDVYNSPSKLILVRSKYIDMKESWNDRVITIDDFGIQLWNIHGSDLDDMHELQPLVDKITEVLKKYEQMAS